MVIADAEGNVLEQSDDFFYFNYIPAEIWDTQGEQSIGMVRARLDNLPEEVQDRITALSREHVYLVRVEGISAEQRNEIIAKMAEQGIACNVHYKPLPMLTAYKNLGFRMEDYPNAYAQFENEITLPLYSTLSTEDAEYIADTFVRILEEY